jgi:hypothetical protein
MSRVCNPTDVMHPERNSAICKTRAFVLKNKKQITVLWFFFYFRSKILIIKILVEALGA